MLSVESAADGGEASALGASAPGSSRASLDVWEGFEAPALSFGKLKVANVVASVHFGEPRRGVEDARRTQQDVDLAVLRAPIFHVVQLACSARRRPIQLGPYTQRRAGVELAGAYETSHLALTLEPSVGFEPETYDLRRGGSGAGIARKKRSCWCRGPIWHQSTAELGWC